MFAGCPCPREPQRVLKPSESDGRQVLACRGCSGVFIDAELGLRLLAVLDAAVPPHDEDVAHPLCPVCRQNMRRAAPQGVAVEVEICAKHGVWFDRGDLSLVARAAAKALGKPVPAAIEALETAKAAKPLVEPEPTGREPAPAAGGGWTSFEREAQARDGGPQSAAQPATSRASKLAYDVADVGVEAAGAAVGAVDTAVSIVAIPVELTLAAVSGLGSLFD